MASFTRFFILALPPLLGVTSYAGPAFLFAAVMMSIMLAASLLTGLTRDALAPTTRFWVLVAQTTLLVTLVDLLVSMLAPEIRSAWGIYLNLLALSPLVLVLPVEDKIPLRTAVLLVALIAAMGLVRELLGLGTLSLVPGKLAWKVPSWTQPPLAILATTGGAFFLASASMVIYRVVGPLLPGLLQESEPHSPPSPAAAKVKAAAVRDDAPPAVERRAQPRPPLSATEEWGEHLEDVVTRLSADKTAGKKRLLVIGAGNGELVYYLAMQCLEAQKTAKTFQFRVRGVDPFATRIETAVKGIYRDKLLDFVPPALQDAWLTRGKDEDKNLLRVANEPRLHIQFEVADFPSGGLYFPLPSHLTVINQGVEHTNGEKKTLFLKQVCENLLPGAALVILGPFSRESVPEGMKRTGKTVFRKA